jgi:hypothetical protein
VPEQHDDDEGDELPEELGPGGQPEGNGDRVDIGHADREGDQRQHSRLPLTQLAREPAQERPAAVEVDDRGKQQDDEAATREVELVTEEVLDHRREHEDRRRQRQRDPEAPAEVVHHGRVATVADMPRATAWRRRFCRLPRESLVLGLVVMMRAGLLVRL